MLTHGGSVREFYFPGDFAGDGAVEFHAEDGLGCGGEDAKLIGIAGNYLADAG